MLYIVATPIGNLEDITLRALETIQNADLVIVESFADSKKLLNAYDIQDKEIIVYNDSNKKRSTNDILKKLKQDKRSAVYITSAGTPALSDPGADLTRICLDNDIKVYPVPGVSAFATLLSVSGVRTKNILFVGFLPKRPGKVKKVFEKIDEDTALLFYESKFRLLKSLEKLSEIHPNAQVVVGREMTKKFEEYIYKSVDEAMLYFNENPKHLKGEFSILCYI